MARHGLVLPTRGSVLASDDASELQTRTEDDVIGLASRAEALGFDSVWVGDSVVAKPRHEPLTTLGAVVGATESVTVGTAVYLPALRHPVHVGHATATLSLLSGGRFALGVGTGSVPREYHALGAPWGDRGGALDEALDVITGLWSGEPVTYDGTHVGVEDAGLGFAPASRPPVYVGSTAHPERGLPRPIRRRVVAHGAGWFPVKAPPAAVELGREQLAGDLEAAGRETDLEVLYYQDVVLADDEAEARSAARRFVEAYYPGLSLTDDQLEQWGAFGTPQQVAEHLDRYEAAGVDHFVTRFAGRDQHEQVERFADLVA